MPRGDQVFLDHVGHFVADPTAAAAALARIGFTPTPASIQTNPDPNGGLPRLTGTGNVCAMLSRGYVEVLFKTADTPLGAEFDAARARYDGLHLAAFATDRAAETHARLAQAGFAMQPIVSMQRPVGTETGEGLAAFEVVRLAPGQMPEGRIQMLRHLTEDTVWQPRWLTHPNGAMGLRALCIVVEDVEEASARLARFTGRPAAADAMGKVIRLDRGELVIASAEAWRKRWPEIAAPSLPYMGECRIEVRDIATMHRYIEAAGLDPLRVSDRSISVPLPEALGRGVWTFTRE